MSRIKTCFDQIKASGRKGLIPFITAGDPCPTQAVAIMHALVEAGADLIELGVPFSDPMADGPVIQRASERALAKGIGTIDVLGYVEQFRLKNTTTPVVLMGYANPIERMGIQTFVTRAQSAGVDGVLVVDYPPEESEIFAQTMQQAGLDPIFLLAPTSTEERIQKVSSLATGYLYYVSLLGVTGATHLNTKAVGNQIPMIRRHTQLPVAVGFGIGDAQSACAVASMADAVVIGSALIKAMEFAKPEDAATVVKNFILPIRQALDQLSRSTA